MRLFFSTSLSEGFEVACASCHHPALGGADGLSPSIGTGAVDPAVLGPGRRFTGGAPDQRRAVTAGVRVQVSAACPASPSTRTSTPAATRR